MAQLAIKKLNTSDDFLSGRRRMGIYIEYGGADFMGKYQKYEVIETGTEPYNVLAEARELWHSDLDAAAIALAWEAKVKMDTDGHVRLGKCVKVTELYREFADFDFVIVLNREIWPVGVHQREKAGTYGSRALPRRARLR